VKDVFAIQQHNSPHVNDFMKEIDVNNDGKIDAKEFNDGLKGVLLNSIK